jgi:hypothetical protein
LQKEEVTHSGKFTHAKAKSVTEHMEKVISGLRTAVFLDFVLEEKHISANCRTNGGCLRYLSRKKRIIVGGRDRIRGAWYCSRDVNWLQC